MKKIFNILFIFILTFTFLLINNNVLVNAETSIYSNVLDDLSIDENFDIDNYSTKSIEDYISFNSDNDSSNDFEIAEIIQIAESFDNELFIYVYCPTYQEYTPNIKKINLFDEFVETLDDEFNPILFDLQLINKELGFFKYKVVDYQVSSLAIRYYSIIELQRLPNSIIDDSVNYHTLNYKTINVSQQWRTYYLNDQLVYEMDKLDTVVIDITINGTLFFEGTSKLTWYLAKQSNNTRSYFIAFNSLNYQIDEIYNAKLSYYKTARSFSRTGGYEYIEESAGSSWHTVANLGTPELIYDSVSNMESVNIETPGIFGKKFNWNRIMTGKDFISNLTKQGASLNCSETLNESQWVFTYHEYDVLINESYGFYSINDYVIDEVKILTLYFRSGRETFNLGVVSDITSSDNKDDGGYTINDFKDSFNEMFEKIIAIIALLFLIVVISFIKPVFDVLLLPFKLILKLFKTKKNKKPKK